MVFNRIKRPVAGTVLVAFLSLVLQPLSVLAQDRPGSLPAARAQQQSETGEDRFSRTLNEIHDILREVAPWEAMPHMFRGADRELRAIGPNMKIEVEPAKVVPGVDIAAKVSQLRTKAKELASLEHYVRAGFEATERQIRDMNLPAEFLVRHREAVSAYESRANEFKLLLGAVERAASGGAALQTALSDLGAFMAKYPNQKPHTATDPNQRPWGNPKPVTREPYTSPSQFRTSRLFGEPIRVAQTGSLSGINLPSTTLPATPVPADTAPTEDVQITQAIRDLATSLNNNPVQIYNWVRNNIQFVPTYGSIQGSDVTFQAKRGNAFDTASLLIALLRAANIPARYVYGTIEVPVDKAMNWVGGVTVPRAAINLMGQGGIPALGVTQSGVVRSVRLEHVWVEAFVDYVPSRGAINRTPQTWVPLDASFKQYQHVAGMDIKTNVPFDSQAFRAQLMQGAIVNEAEGWVQNLNQTLAQQALVNYQTQITSYVNSHKPNATVGDVLGAQLIVQENRPILLGTLPYATVVTGAKFQAFPDSLRHRLTIKLYTSDFARADDSPAVSYVASLPALAAKRVSLTYEPASPADRSVIDSAFNSGQTRYPAYLIRVVPSLKVENAVVGAGAAVAVGQDHFLSVTLTKPYDAHEAVYPVTSGDVSVLSLDPAGITPDQFHSRSAQQNLRQGNVPNAAEEMLYQVGLAYWGQHQALKQTIAETQGVRFASQPGHGVAAALVTVQYSFGVARNAYYASRSMDIRENLLAAEAIDGNVDARRNYMLTVGQVASYLEGGIWEQAFLIGGGNGISSVSALSISAQRGIPIHTVTGETLDLALAQLTVAPEVKSRIQNAVLVGYRVTVPRHPTTIGNFTGTGYIIEDPQTGGGFYEISGGRQGGGGPAPASVFAVPEAPANPVIGILLGSALRQAGAALVVEGGMILGVAIPVGVAIGAVALLIAAIILLLLILMSQSRTIDDKYPRTNLRLRHYTNAMALIVSSKFVLESLGGSFGAGVYFAHADNEDERGFGCPPNSVAIVTRFQIPPPPAAPDPTRVTGYVDLLITRLNYYTFDSQPNGVGETEIIVREPLLPTPIPLPTGQPRRGLFFGLGAFGIELSDVCE
jgi:hypothetical protein